MIHGAPSRIQRETDRQRQRQRQNEGQAKSVWKTETQEEEEEKQEEGSSRRPASRVSSSKGAKAQLDGKRPEPCPRHNSAQLIGVTLHRVPYVHTHGSICLNSRRNKLRKGSSKYIHTRPSNVLGQLVRPRAAPLS